MKPKPFWPLNHFTVPLFMGNLPLDANIADHARTQPIWFEVLEKVVSQARCSRQADSFGRKLDRFLNSVARFVAQAQTAARYSTERKKG